VTRDGGVFDDPWATEAEPPTPMSHNTPATQNGRSEPGHLQLSFPEEPPEDDMPEQDPYGLQGSGSTRPAAPLLPNEFWEARPYLRFIRKFAHNRGVSADAVFMATLARLAAMVPNTCRVDTKMHTPVSLNTMVAVVGPSSVGKTSAYSIARHVLEGTIPLDNLQLSTGEGIAEAYMIEEKVDPTEGDWSDGGQGAKNAKSGRGRLLTVRRQGFWNAFLHLDEGEAMFKEFDREGAKLGPILRSAWLGHIIGNQNADRSRVRKITDFSLGLVVGFQPQTALPLLRDAHTGTPQRFLWCSVLDPNIPRGRPEPTKGQLAWRTPQLGQNITGGLYEPQDGTWKTSMTCHPAIADSRCDLHTRKNRGEVEIDVLDGHRPITMIKIAGLLAVLDGRLEVSLQDWALAGMVWDYSVAIRTALIELDQQERRQRSVQRLEQRRADAAAEQEGKQETIDKNAARHAQQAAARIVTMACRTPGGLMRKEVRTALGQRLRPHMDEALDLAVGSGSVVEVGGRWFCGHTPSCYRGEEQP
jgi:hypothetical protein